MTKKNVTIYTDGACSGNPGPGGWGAWLKYGHHKKEIYGGAADTTNNRMELTAAIEGLKALKHHCLVDLYTDSTYVKDGITKWIHNWKQKDWKNAQKKPVKNAELWQKLDKEVARHTVKWHWVKGHAGNEGNEMADSLANKGMEKYK